MKGSGPGRLKRGDISGAMRSVRERCARSTSDSGIRPSFPLFSPGHSPNLSGETSCAFADPPACSPSRPLSEAQWRASAIQSTIRRAPTRRDERLGRGRRDRPAAILRATRGHSDQPVGQAEYVTVCQRLIRLNWPRSMHLGCRARPHVPGVSRRAPPPNGGIFVVWCPEAWSTTLTGMSASRPSPTPREPDPMARGSPGPTP
jgi:hypothetical protein